MNARTRTAVRRSHFHTLETPEREVYLLLQHVSGALMQELAAHLKPDGITPEQYHILQILRDSGADGLPCSVVAERSVSGDPDVTRLLDRLEMRGWATRARDEDDRRVVMARITGAGSRFLAKLEDSVAAVHERQMETLGTRELAALKTLLEKLMRTD